MAVNLIVDFAGGRFGDDTVAEALEAAAVRGYRLVLSAAADDRLAAWIDWQFAPSWWSAEARASNVFCAYDARGEICGFAAFDARGLRFPWLRGYAGSRDIGIFGPFGVAPAHRKTGVGAALLDAALGTLNLKGYARALIPAVGYDRLITMYRARTGARIAESFSYDSPRRYRTTILASGSGTNAEHVFKRVAANMLPLEVGAVVVNVPDAAVIGRAAAAGVPTIPVVWDRGRESRAAYDARVVAAVAAADPDLILLLGWMHVLPPVFIERFAEILNLHPAFLPFDPRSNEVVLPDGSVLPAFRGAHALRDALAAGARWTGASVHRVTTEVDRGAIVVRTPMRIDAAVDAATIAGRLRPIEHAAVAAAVRRWTFERTFHETDPLLDAKSSHDRSDRP